MSTGWICSDCKRLVFVARVWDDRVECQDCYRFKSNGRIFKHEIETPMRGHDDDGGCCLRAKLGVEA